MNEQRSHLEINTGYRHSLSPNPTERERLVEKMQDAAPRFWEHERADVFTHEYAIEAMKSRKPELIYIGYGDIDELAHMGDYRLYLEGARTFDNFLKEIWEYIQSDPFYKDQTTLIITCDHGRGCGKVKADDWRDHGTNTTGSGETWFMAIGKDIPALGEISGDRQYYNNQVAATIADFLQIPFAPKHPQAGKKMEF